MKTREFLVMAMAAAGLYASMSSDIAAAPASGAAILGLLQDDSLVQDVRVFCYNRRTGRFLHWGRCGTRRVSRARPRVYCYNRRTGRFLHWGSCRR